MARDDAADLLDAADVLEAFAKFAAHRKQVRALEASGLVEIHDVAAAVEAYRVRASINAVAAPRHLVGEARACAAFDAMTGLGSIDFASPVSRVEKELRVASLRIDRVVFHDDESVTVVEVKPDGCRRDVSHGIGQALMYAAAAVAAGLAKEVRPALFVSGEADPLIAEACRLGGVTYLVSGDVRWWSLAGMLVEALHV